MSATLVLHAGGKEVSVDDLARVDLPESTKTWVPIKHTTVLSTATDTLAEAGYAVVNRRLALSNNGSRFFGVLDLSTELTTDGMVTLAVGIRSSYDKSFPLGFCAGSRVFICDNLAFRADLMVKRKHTLHGASRFSSDIAHAVQSLQSFKEAEAARIAHMQEMEITDAQAESLMLRACVVRGIVGQRHLPLVYREWHEPRHEVFQPRTAWSLLNAFTAVMHELQTKNPAELAHRTMRLHAFLVPPQAQGPAIADSKPALAI
jgi:hypothetical protein